MPSMPTAVQRTSIPLLQMATACPTEQLPFIVQPLLQPRNGEIFGWEVLYRGTHPVNRDWTGIDTSMIRFLANHKMSVSLFVNLSNDTVLTIDEDLLFAASKKNSLFFEWSEVISEEPKFKAVIRKINDWTKRGLRFVIDDFGAGRDGFERLFAIDRITAIKFDGAFFRTASHNLFASKMIEHIINECAGKDILTVAECVESERDYRFAESLGIDLAQGYFVDDIYNAAVAPRMQVAL